MAQQGRAPSPGIPIGDSFMANEGDSWEDLYLPPSCQGCGLSQAVVEQMRMAAYPQGPYTQGTNSTVEGAVGGRVSAHPKAVTLVDLDPGLRPE
jgi:hypothetical protein